MKSYTELRDAIESALRDSTNAVWSTAELDYNITQGLRAISDYKERLVRITYKIETRTGKATATSSGNLVDSDESQFLSSDTGKRVHNTDDNTWADIISHSSASQVGLSHDIMANGEAYEIYNKGCWNNRQFNIEDVEDYVGDNRGIRRIEFPVGTERNIEFIQGDIVEIALDIEPDDSADDDANVDIYVWFNKRHKLSQLTAFTGAVDLTAGYDKGDISMVIDGLTDDDVIEVDQEFTLAYRPQIYTVTTAVTVASSEATVSFYPGLDADVANDIAVTWVQSTLDRELEELLIEYIVGKALMDEANTHLNAISVGGGSVYKQYLETASFRYNNALRQLQGMARPRPSKILPRT